MNKPYKNAADVLPPQLLKEVQQCHVGLLWVPASSDFYEKRDAGIEALYRRGVGTAEIAGLSQVTERRVRQILQKRGVPRRKGR